MRCNESCNAFFLSHFILLPQITLIYVRFFLPRMALIYANLLFAEITQIPCYSYA